jgi:hypothetical protein
VQVIKMKEKEKTRSCLALYPSHGLDRHLLPQALDIPGVPSSLAVELKLTVVMIEALVQTEAPIENKPSDKGGRRVSLRP